ncbi:hypothetical protein [Streptomyces sp. NPDC004291]
MVSAVADSPTPGDPEIWDNLEFSSRNDTGSVSISIHELWLSVTVRGSDATWVHGQAARIRALLDPVANEELPWERQHRTAAKIAGSAGIVTLVSSFLTLREIDNSASLGDLLLGTFTITSFVVIIFFLLGTQGKAKRKVFLNVVGEVSDTGWWKGLSTTEKVAFGALIATIAAAIGTLGSAYSDLWGAK